MSIIRFIFTGDTKHLDDAAKNAKQSLKEVGKEFREGVNTSAKWGAAMAVAGAAITVNLINKGREAIDVQAKLAQSLNTTVASIGVLERAGDLAGVSIDGIAQATKDLTRRLSQAAAQGAGPTFEALQKLNMSASDLLRMPLDERVSAINSALNEFVPAANRAAVAGQLFGEEGSLAMMRISPETIKEAARQAEIFGTAISEIDAIKIEQANDAFSTIQTGMDGFTKQLAIQAAPVIDAIGKHFLGAAQEAGGMRNIAVDAFDKIVTGVAFAIDAVDGLKRVFKVVADAIIIALNKVAAFITDKLALHLELLSKLPGVDFSETISDLRDFSVTAEGVVDEAMNNIGETLNKPMPSGAFKKWVEEAKASSQQVAEAVAQSRVEPINIPQADEGMSDEERKKQEAALEAIKQKYITVEELERIHRENMALIGEEFDAAKFETEAQWMSVREQAQAEHIERLKAITATGYEGISSIINMHWGKVAASTAGAVKSIVGTMATGSRKAFEVSKAWAMADALISTYQGIAAGVKLGWPMAIPAVAWAAATGFAQVSAIRSQQFGGAGGAAASGNGTPATAPNPVGVGGATGGNAPGQTLTVAPLDPNAIFSGSAMQSFGQQIYNFSKDGGKVIFSA